MTIRRLFILQAVLFAGLAIVFFLPKPPAHQPTGVDHLGMPKFIGHWYGADQLVSEREKEVLGKDTQFARKSYSSPSGRIINVTVVLSGQDMNTSIHRAERCMRAQGWLITNSEVVGMALPEPRGAALRATRLRDTHSQDPNLITLNYYWFVGYNDLTPSHVERTMIDVRDRLLKGYNQRWAYVLVSSQIPRGALNPEEAERKTDDLVKSFIKELVPKIHKASVKYG